MSDQSSQSWLRRVRERLAGLRLDPATEAEVVDELTQHVEDRYQELRARGAREDDAVRQAWQELEGHPRLAGEISSSKRQLPVAAIQDTSHGGVRALWDDFVFAWRRLRHAPGFAIVALAIVTLTIGANTAILSVADGVLFRPLPYADPESVAIIQLMDRKTGRQYTMTPYPFIEAINDGCPDVSDVALLETFTGTGRATIESADGVRPVPLMSASSNYFTLLGVRPQHGRLFSAADAGQEGRVAVLSHQAWVRYFGQDPSVIGRTVPLGEVSLDIVGVLPASFIFPSLFADRNAIVVLRGPLNRGTKGGTVHAIVRVTRGTPREVAQAQVEAASAAVSSSIGRSDSTPRLNDVRTVLYPVGRPVMRFLLAAAFFILILGCANLANLLVVRGRRRLHDTAVHLALGASRVRLIRPLVLEALIIGLAGALLAVILTSLGFDALLRQVPPAAYGFGRTPVGVDTRIAGMAVAMGAFCALAFSVIPAWRASGVDVVALIRKRAGRGSSLRIGRPLIALQVAIAVTVVFGAIVATRAFVAVLQQPLGFSAESVLRISAPVPRDVTNRRAFYERIVQTLASRPDVVAVGAASSLPFSGSGADEGAFAIGAKRPVAGIVHVLPGFLEAASISLVRGRSLTWDDARSDPNVAVVSESAARALFPAGEPLGSLFSNGRDRELRVVGIVQDVVTSLTATDSARVYAMPVQAVPLTVVARMHGRRESAIQSIHTELRSLAAGRAADIVWWADQIAMDNAFRDPRFQTIVLSSLAAIALALTAPVNRWS